MPLLGVVFDFDGVIADTEALHLRAYQDTFAETPLSLSKTDYFERYLGYDDVGVVTAVARDQGIVLEEPELSRLTEAKSRRFQSLVDTEGVLFPGSSQCIQRLAGRTKLAVASGALHHEIDSILAMHALLQYFEVIVAADDVARQKPAPDGYLRAVACLSHDSGRPPSSFFVAIEDSRWGLEAARAAGLRTVGITHTYGASTLKSADVVVDSLDVIDYGFLAALCP